MRFPFLGFFSCFLSLRQHLGNRLVTDGAYTNVTCHQNLALILTLSISQSGGETEVCAMQRDQDMRRPRGDKEPNVVEELTAVHCDCSIEQRESLVRGEAEDIQQVWTVHEGLPVGHSQKFQLYSNGIRDLRKVFKQQIALVFLSKNKKAAKSGSSFLHRRQKTY